MNENGVALGESEQALQKVSPARVVAKNLTALDSAADDVIPASSISMRIGLDIWEV